MLGAAARADRLNLAMDMPVAVANLDIDAAVGIIGGEEDGTLLARAFPTVDGWPAAATGGAPRSDFQARHHLGPSAGYHPALMIEHLFLQKGILRTVRMVVKSGTEVEESRRGGVLWSSGAKWRSCRRWDDARSPDEAPSSEETRRV